jgi:hypothetical protein
MFLKTNLCYETLPKLCPCHISSYDIFDYFTTLFLIKLFEHKADDTSPSYRSLLPCLHGMVHRQMINVAVFAVFFTVVVKTVLYKPINTLHFDFSTFGMLCACNTMKHGLLLKCYYCLSLCVNHRG